MNERLRYRLGLRASNAAAPWRNRFREARIDPPWLFPDDFHDLYCDDQDESSDANIEQDFDKLET